MFWELRIDNDNFVLLVQDADMVKYGRDEDLQGNPLDLMSARCLQQPSSAFPTESLVCRRV